MLLVLSQTGQAHSPARPAAFRMDSLVVHAGAHPLLGDTVNLIFAFTANVGGMAKINLHFPGVVGPPDRHAGEKWRDSTIFVAPGSHYVYTLPLKLNSYGSSLVEATVRPAVPFPYLSNVAGGYFEVGLSPTVFDVRYQFDAVSNDTIHVTMESPDLVPLAHLHIRGKLDYQDVNQILIDSLGNPDTLTKGAYGDTVLLLFYKRIVSGADTTLWNYASFPYPGCVDSVHYSVADTGGNFLFDFTANLANWNDYVGVALLPTKGNRAAFITNENSYSIKGLTCGDRETFGLSYCKVLGVNGMTSIYYDSVEITLNFDDGAILRNAQFSQEFDSVRPVGAVPPRINMYVIPASSSEAGDFESEYDYVPGPPGINIVTLNASSATVSHEWGHYLHFTYSPETFELATTYPSFSEGFADFHQFCVRNYTSAKYGEFQVWGNDNTEESPFFVLARYNGMPYADPPYHDTAYTAFACFLWNVYDKYVDPGFRAARYNDSDNDDVGESALIWQKMAHLDTFMTSTGTFKDSLQKAVDSVEAQSIQKIYNFMFGDKAPMRPAQVKNLQAVNYSFPMHLSWQTWDYLVVSSAPISDYSNPADSIHIYGSSDSGWVLRKTVGANDTSADIFGPFFDSCKVSTFNGSGDAYGAPVIGLNRSSVLHPLAMREITGPLAVSIYPNPASKLVRICVDSLMGGEPFLAEVVGPKGDQIAKLYEATPESDLGLCFRLDCTGLANGSYFVRVANSFEGGVVKFEVVR